MSKRRRTLADVKDSNALQGIRDWNRAHLEAREIFERREPGAEPAEQSKQPGFVPVASQTDIS